ncbi:hypothetical protein K438DRAFT_1753749 [Mycena galopus ATCC 62051]|nr:hypothetical protein K438DRAFT_1753749 [Mycena galopus ATCC 62051]
MAGEYDRRATMEGQGQDQAANVNCREQAWHSVAGANVNCREQAWHSVAGAGAAQRRGLCAGAQQAVHEKVECGAVQYAGPGAAPAGAGACTEQIECLQRWRAAACSAQMNIASSNAEGGIFTVIRGGGKIWAATELRQGAGFERKWDRSGMGDCKPQGGPEEPQSRTVELLRCERRARGEGERTGWRRKQSDGKGCNEETNTNTVICMKIKQRPRITIKEIRDQKAGQVADRHKRGQQRGIVTRSNTVCKKHAQDRASSAKKNRLEAPVS